MARNSLFKDLTGQRFGSWLVLGFEGSHPRNKHSVWRARCDCGREQLMSKPNLGNRGKCKECAIREQRTHGLAGTPTYCAWIAMKGRCYNPNDPRYSHYGARGIKVCGRWRYSFEKFLADMGERPVNTKTREFSIGRIDNDKDYSPKNCRWENQIEQANNKTNTRYITWNGKTQTLSQWARESGLNRETLRDRIDHYGWSLEDALTKPLVESRVRAWQTRSQPELPL